MIRQHLIDPEICIRCNTCEDACKTGAITHDSRNYVVKPDVCNACGDCLPPCPTGAIDNWRRVLVPFPVEAQLGWDALPPDTAPVVEESDARSLPAEVAAITAEAAPVGAPPPWSAAHPYVNLYGRANPAIATVAGNHRITDERAASDIHHLVLDFGTTAFPVLEGQSIGIVPPGVGADGRPHAVRLYSVASPRDGERPGYNNVALTVKRVVADHDGRAVRGVASNYLCDLERGARVEVVGPYGATFLMPNHPGANLLMVCTGTGAAPMRAMTERRRRRLKRGAGPDGRLMLFFGARTPGELPYFGPLMRLPRELIDVNLAFSRVEGEPKRHVQDLIRARGPEVARLLSDPNTFVYVCGVKGMEQGVEAAFAEACAAAGVPWDARERRAAGRLHVETY